VSLAVDGANLFPAPAGGAGRRHPLN